MCMAHSEDLVKGTLQKMQALEAEYRASLELFNAMKAEQKGLGTEFFFRSLEEVAL